MEQYIDKKFNELVIKKIVPKPDNAKYESWNTSRWVECECSCGKTVTLPLYGIINDKIKSCGHLRSEIGTGNLDKYRRENGPPNAVMITCKNKTYNIKQWSDKTGIPRTTIMARLEKGLTPEEALEAQ